jgi:hypothetical protein
MKAKVKKVEVKVKVEWFYEVYELMSSVLSRLPRSASLREGIHSV